MISPESRAIVESTAPLVQSRRAGLLFQMWHDLGSSPGGRLLFDTFTADGKLIGLLEAIVIAAKSPGTGLFPRLLLEMDGPDRCALRKAVEPVLIVALGVVLGELATPDVLDAWRDAFRLLMRS